MKSKLNKNKIRKLISTLLALMIILSTVLASAATGDIINTKSQQLFKFSSPTQSEDILNAIESGADINSFYKIVESNNGRKYINIGKTEQEQEQYLSQLLLDANINLNDPQAISDFIGKNPSIATEMQQIETANAHSFSEIPDIGDQVEELYYGGDLTASLKTPDNYSIPEEGTEENTTQIQTLTLPEGSYSWMIKILDSNQTSIQYDQELKEEDGYQAYSQGEDIEIEARKHLALYAVNTSNKAKAFASISIAAEMIKQPRKLAEDLSQTELKDTKIEKLENIANAVKVIDLPALDAESTYEYKVILKDAKIEKLYQNLETPETDFVNNIENIKVSDGQIDEEFIKYIYILKLNKEEPKEILGYREFEIEGKNINSPAPILDEDKYTGPVKGEADGSTKFTELEGIFKYVIANKVDLPTSDMDYSDIGIWITADKEILPTTVEEQTLIGKEMLLVSLASDGKVESYAKFDLSTDNVKGQTAPELGIITPKKGGLENTTQIPAINVDTNPGVNIEDIDDATKLMYEILDAALTDSIMINDTKVKSKDLVLGEDIVLSPSNKWILILATDDIGKIKAYKSIEIIPEMIKDPVADELKPSYNYREPEKGSIAGTAKFDYLEYDDSDSFHYITTDGEIETPEKGSDLPTGTNPIEFITGTTKTENIKIKEETDEKLKDEKGFTTNMMVYAVKDEKVQAYKKFVMNQDNVKLPKATELPEANYGQLSPGEAKNSTRLDKLNQDGLNPNLRYYYKFIPSVIEVGINEKLNPSSKLEKDKDLIGAKDGEFLLILLVDSEKRTKYYKTIALTDLNVRGLDADGLLPSQHYTNPIPGSVKDSTKFKHLGLGIGKDFIKDATQYMVKISEKSMGNIEINKIATEAEGFFTYAKITGDGIVYQTIVDKSDGKGNILGVDKTTNKYLLLLATDDTGKIKAYKQFTLNDNNIRGGDAKEIPAGNYELGIGGKPSTTKFTKLVNDGFSTSMTWIYKWSPTNIFVTEKPYIDQVNTDKDFKTITPNKDIVVNEIKGATDTSLDPKYGYILLYGVNGSKIQGYAAIPVSSDVVKEHADELTSVSISDSSIPTSMATKTDHVKVIGTGTYKYIISKDELDIPAKNEKISSEANEMSTDKEILVSIGQYLTIYQVDSEDEVIGYKSFQIEAKHIKQGSAKFEEITEDNPEIEILEGSLNNGSYEIKITLTDADWSNDLWTNERVRNQLFDSFQVDKEAENWNKIIAGLKAAGRYAFELSCSGKTLTISTARTDDYDISEEQRITLTIPAVAIKDANNPIKVKGTIVVKPTVGARISGSILTENRQSDINSGEATIIVTLEDGRFKSWTDDNKTTLINGFVGDGGKDSPWNKTDGIRAKILSDLKNNVKTQGGDEVKIIIPSNSVVDFGIKSEKITLTIPKEIITDGIEDGKEDVVATPRFEIRPDILRVEGEIDLINSIVEVEAPLYKNILDTANKWIIDITVGTVKEDLSIKDIEIAGLDGLKATANKVAGENQIEITLSGISRNSIAEGGKDLEITIKGSAITEENSLDSKVIHAKINRQAGQDEMIKNLNLVTIDVAKNSLASFNEATMQYSLNSKNGTDGDWYTELSKIGNDLGGFKPGKVYIRSSGNHKVYRLLADLKSAPAPKNIKIGEINYTSKKITITGLDPVKSNTDYEYTTDGGANWDPLTNPITLSSDANEIRIRLASTTSDLYSLPTSSLKFVNLADVKMNVAEKEITGTLSSMQYKFGDDGSPKSASNGTTKNVAFEEGDLIVFERSNPENSREVATVESTDAPKKDDLTFHILNGTVTGEELEFTITNFTSDKYDSIKDSEWVDTSTVALINFEFEAGSLVFRKKATDKALASPIILKKEILPKAEGPKLEDLEIDNLDKEIKYNEKFLGDSDFELEYRIGTSNEWKESTSWVDPDGDKEKIKDQDVSIYLRIKAEEHILPSKETKIDLTANIDLDGVGLNLGEGLLETTSSRMEYSFNSTDGIDGDWRLASNGNTKIISIDKLHELEGKIIYIRQNKNEKNNRLITFEEGTPETPETPKPIVREDTVAKEKILVSYKDKDKEIKVSNDITQDIEVKLGNGNWITVSKDKPIINVNFVSGEDITYRTKASADKIYSLSALKEMVPYPGATPFVKYDDKDNKITAIGQTDKTSIINLGYEFKEKTSENWLDAKANLGTRVFIGDTIVQIRKSATDSQVASTIKEITFTKNLDWGKVGFDKYGNPPQILNTSPEMEYQIFFRRQEPPNTWKKTIKGNTSLSEIGDIKDVSLVLVRDARTKTDENIVYGDSDDRPVDLAAIKYKLSENKITFTGITDKMEYKKSTDSTWADGSDLAGLINLPLEPIELTIRDKNYPTKTRTIKVEDRAEKPNIKVDKYDYEDNGTISLTLSGFDKETMEYSIDGGNNYITWASTVSKFNLAKNHIFLVRAKAVETDLVIEENGKLPSLATEQLNGIYIGDIGINLIEKKIEGTSNFMEYSLNSTDGKDGDWTGAISPDTPTADIVEGSKIWIREILKPINARELSEKVTREINPSETDIEYHVSEGTIANKTIKDLKYRIAGGQWVELPANKIASSVNFQAGDFHILAKGGKETLDSEPVLVTTIKAQASPPNIKGDDITNKVTEINNIKVSDDPTAFNDFEYKLSTASHWIEGTYLAGEVFVGEKIVQIRKKATDTELSSQIAEITFTGLDLRKVGLSIHTDPYELNGTSTEMQYRITIGGSVKGWIQCTTTNTTNGNTQLYYMDSSDTKVNINVDNFSTTDASNKIEIRKSNDINEEDDPDKIILVEKTTTP